MATTVPNNPFDLNQQKVPGAEPSLPGQGIVASAINNASGGQSAAQASSAQPAVLPPEPQIQTYTPQASQVDRATETAAGQVDSLLASDSPLLQRARTIARQNMAQRGLVNSSMAQGAGVAAMIDRITPIAQQDAQIFGTRSLANMEAINQAGLFNAGEANKFSLQRSDQQFTAGQNQAQRDFTAAQAELERAQQVALADKSIAAQQALQTAQQNFQAAQAALDRTQQVTLQTAQQNFAAAQAALDRAQQISLADKSIAANQALQQAQQEFQRAQNELDRQQNLAIADKNISAAQTQLQSQQTFNASQAALDRQNQTALQSSQIAANQAAQTASQAFQASQTSLQIASQNSANASAFISRTIDQANVGINAIIADGNLTPESKRIAIQNIVDSTNSSLRWAATFYNTTVPGYTAPGGAASVLNPGAGAGGGNANTTTRPAGAATRSEIESIYQQVFGRSGDASGLNFWYESGYTPNQIREAFMNSDEYRNRQSGGTTTGGGTAGNTGGNTGGTAGTNTGGGTATAGGTPDPVAQAIASATAPQRAYLEANPDVVDYYYRNNIGGTEGVSLGDFAQRHYTQAGFNEGRNGYGLTPPSQNTGTSNTGSTNNTSNTNTADPVQQALAGTSSAQRAYLEANPDVLNYWFNNDTGMSLGDFAQYHYEVAGVNEGRAGQGLIARNMTGGGGGGFDRDIYQTVER